MKAAQLCALALGVCLGASTGQDVHEKHTLSSSDTIDEELMPEADDEVAQLWRRRRRGGCSAPKPGDCCTKFMIGTCKNPRCEKCPHGDQYVRMGTCGTSRKCKEECIWGKSSSATSKRWTYTISDKLAGGPGTLACYDQCDTRRCACVNGDTETANRVPTSNGCGPERFGKFLTGLGKTIIANPMVNKCCDAHDTCFGGFAADKSACDRALSMCWNEAAAKMVLGVNKNLIFNQMAKAFINSDAGREVFDSSQQRSTKCPSAA